MKDNNTVIEEFNSIVNMTAPELKKWLEDDKSRDAGWSKDDGSGETVGHDSGRQIMSILEANPKKDPSKYTDDQIQHMRKVVSYCKRHLSQEEKMIREKSEEEVKESKSYISLKNWGHDPLKGKSGDEVGGKDEGEAETGGKRKKAASAQDGENKKRETRQGKGQKKDDDKEEEEEEYDEDDDNGDDQEANGDDEVEGKEDDGDDNEEEDDDEDDDGGGDDEGEDEGKKHNGSGKKAKKGPKPGDTVSWNWGNGQPEGKVLDVKAEK